MSELWNGFRLERLTFEEYDALVVIPDQPDAKRRLAVKTEYWDAFPEAIEIDLVKQGFHLCYIKNDGRWGAPANMERKARFIRFVQETYGLCDTCVPVGMSAGGLQAVKLAGYHPELVSCLYLDAPAINLYSCPCAYGRAEPRPAVVAELMNDLGIKTVSELICYRDMPMHHLPTLVKHKIPVVMVAGDRDHLVPYEENGSLLEQDYRAAGVDIQVHIKPGCDHHPHGLEDNAEVLEFILKHS